MSNAKYWWAVLYQENMRTDWEDRISELVQIPYAYCKHTKDIDTKSEHRKDHVHIILAFPNTTTYNHAYNVFSELNADGKQALNTCKQIISIRNAYDYLIHDTPDCQKIHCMKLQPRSKKNLHNSIVRTYRNLKNL